MYACTYARTHVRMYVCMYPCMYVCMHAMPLLLHALHLGRQTFKGSCTTPRSGRLSFIFIEIHTTITLSTNNRITLCSHYVQLSATLGEQLRTIVNNVMRLFFSEDTLYVASSTSQFQKPISIWIGNTMYQGIDRYFFGNVAYPDML